MLWPFIHHLSSITKSFLELLWSFLWHHQILNFYSTLIAPFLVLSLGPYSCSFLVLKWPQGSVIHHFGAHMHSPPLFSFQYLTFCFTQSSEVSSLNPLLCPNSCTIACLLLDIYISKLTVLFLLHIQHVPKPPCPPTQLLLLTSSTLFLAPYPFHHFGHSFCFIFYSQSTDPSNSFLELFPLLYVCHPQEGPLTPSTNQVLTIFPMTTFWGLPSYPSLGFFKFFKTWFFKNTSFITLFCSRHSVVYCQPLKLPSPPHTCV